MKIFTSDGLVLAPLQWRQALGLPDHHQQVHLLVVAKDKQQAHLRLAANAGDANAYHLVRAIRLHKPPLSTPDQALVDAGIVSLELPGVFIYRNGVKRALVAQALPDGSCPLVGHFWMDEGLDARLYARRGHPDSMLPIQERLDLMEVDASVATLRKVQKQIREIPIPAASHGAWGKYYRAIMEIFEEELRQWGWTEETDGGG